MKKIFLCFILLVFLLSCKNKKEEDNIITMFASTSLRNALKEICQNYKSDTGIEVKCLFNSSGKLRETIEAGDCSDIYFSSSLKEVNTLKNEDLLYDDSITNILRTGIVLVVPKNSNLNITSFNDLTNNDIEKIAIGESMTSPIGQYAEQILNTIGIYDEVADKIIFGNDTKHVIDLVKMDKIDCGIVYETEAKFNKEYVKIAAEPSEHIEVIYSAVIVGKTEKKAEAEEFINYLCSDKCIRIFEDYSFYPIM